MEAKGNTWVGVFVTFSRLERGERWSHLHAEGGSTAAASLDLGVAIALWAGEAGGQGRAGQMGVLESPLGLLSVPV